MYTRSMLKCLRGYPLYDPKPFSELSKEYLRNGINVGDVGFVRGSGTFDFLFNVCPSQNGLNLINPPNLPDGFSLETPDHSATTVLESFPPNTRLFQSPIAKTRSGEYICEGSEGAVLELPKGAIQDEAMNTRPFEQLAARHGVQWYKYIMNRGRGISNGSLYLITSVTKSAQWGIAVFDRPCAPGQGLKFDKKSFLHFGKSTSKYRWKGSDTFPTKVSNPDQGDAANQCVFVRGYKIMIRQDIFDNLCNDQARSRSNSAIPSSSPQAGSSTMTRQRATRIRGGAGPDPAVSRLTGAGLFSRTTRTTSDEEVVLHPNFNSSLVHPSDLINAALLSQNPAAQVALTHDDVWCNLLRDNFPKLNYATLINVARSYTHTIEYDCVFLEKISDPSNVLEKSSHPLQGIETPALQEPLTPPVGDYTSVPATISLTLPRELVEHILLLLDTRSMLKCRLVNREFNAIIQSSTLAQYYLACKAAGVVDNPQSPFSYAERLEALKKREDAWRKLKPGFETTIKVFDQPSSLYELTAGNYFLLDHNGKDLYYCRLPSSTQDNPQWFSIPGHGPGQSRSGSIVDMGMAVYEHDLVVNIISSEVGNQMDMQRYSLDLVLLKFSTGEYHPVARHPLIHVQTSPSARPFSNVTIVGDNLALVIHDQDGSKLFIFDWKTGHKRLQHKTDEDGYYGSSPIFVSPELLLVPNSILSNFEVWQLFSHSNSNPPVQILSLQIPAVSDNYIITDLRCYGEPSAFLHSVPHFPPRPFFSSSENSIITVNLRLQSPSAPELQIAYKLIMHRNALLDTIQKWTSPSLLEQQDLPIWLHEVTVHKVADPNDGSVRLTVQSELILTDPGSSSPRDSPTLATSQISPPSPTSHISADSSSGSALSTSRYEIPAVQWADWGPPISRWFEVKGIHKWWNRQSAGQRYVFLDPNPRDKKKYMVAVADFNLHIVRRNAEMTAQLRGEGEDNGDNGNIGEGKKEQELEILDHEGVFSEEVYMGLKCVVHHAPGEYDFDAVLIDEERLLGLKVLKVSTRNDINFFS
ncbi:hypothetical protein M378DRAFT_166125 [Amanita muscaria Koide BX008]|uniref:F-box domain-containing protein n=1 Tax=Amanita muscaria (strain Koide BX008) TaxID=946122 RepID=A0A0C2WKS1_AMAMK|nr:hypothetical protein M378DRAFT_166125 [Amanita muscaria Koide BX008]